MKVACNKETLCLLTMGIRDFWGINPGGDCAEVAWGALVRAGPFRHRPVALNFITPPGSKEKFGLWRVYVGGVGLEGLWL